MKKLFLAMIAICVMPFAYALDTANFKIHISGVHDNTYFLCMPNIGCYSIKHANAGKIFRITHDVQMNTIFVTNQDTLRVHRQGLPASCNTEVKTNQTITISGNLTVDAHDVVHVNQLRCSIS